MTQETAREQEAKSLQEQCAKLGKQLEAAVKNGAYPITWDPMAEGETCRLVELLFANPAHKVELKKVVDFFNESSPRGTVTKVFRIQNKALFSMYAGGRSVVQERPFNNGNCNEHRLFHGARGQGVTEKIIKTGFEALHGAAKNIQGIWLSTNSQYSVSYSEQFEGKVRKMFLVQVSLGYIVKLEGQKPAKVESTNDFGDSIHCGGLSLGHTRKDDRVGNGKDNRYIVFKNNQVYPEYLIEFLCTQPYR